MRRAYGRIWWTTMVDAYSRRILAQYVTFDEPSYRSCMMVIRECVRRWTRLPKTIVVDNGPEFHGCYFKFLMAAFKIAVKFRPKGNPRYGSVQERPYGTANKQFFHKVLGNTKLTKDIRLVVKSHNPILLAVWNMKAMVPRLDEWSYKVFDTQSHSALGMNPRDAFNQGLARDGYYPNSFIRYCPDFIFLTSPTTKKGTAKVIENGPYIVVNYIKYFSHALNNPNVLGKQVEVRYDPFDVGHAWAYIGRKWVECYSEHYAELQGKSEKLIRLIADKINARNKAHPFERRTVNAAILAEFLNGIDQDEKLLLQAMHDDESRELRSGLSTGVPKEQTVEPAQWRDGVPPGASRKRKVAKSAPRVTEACPVM